MPSRDGAGGGKAMAHGGEGAGGGRRKKEEEAKKEPKNPTTLPIPSWLQIVISRDTVLLGHFSLALEI